MFCLGTMVTEYVTWSLVSKHQDIQ